jgi:regulator of replication initiation timing
MEGLCMGNIKAIQCEYDRLRALFTSVEPAKTKLVDNLINEAAFMKVELSKLQDQMIKYGAVQMSTKGAQRQSEAAKYYTKLVNSYGTVIKTLNSILGTQVNDGDDAFDEFLKRANE